MVFWADGKLARIQTGGETRGCCEDRSGFRTLAGAGTARGERGQWYLDGDPGRSGEKEKEEPGVERRPLVSPKSKVWTKVRIMIIKR